jgi:hypothetical protein
MTTENAGKCRICFLSVFQCGQGKQVTCHVKMKFPLRKKPTITIIKSTSTFSRRTSETVANRKKKGTLFIFSTANNLPNLLNYCARALNHPV